MWSDWLVFCDCGFHSACPLMEKDKRRMESSWWGRLTEGKLGLVLMSRAMLSSVQFSCSVMPDSLRPQNHSTTGLPVHYQLLEFTQTNIHQVGDAIQPSHSLSPHFPPAPNPSQHHTLCMRWRKYWSFNFSIIPSKEHPGLISFILFYLLLFFNF